jgi:alpha-keto-acid decarboxylase
MAEPRYSVGNYLTDRLVELGLDRVFGVPGDYTLRLLDYVIEHPGLSWTGCANELNAGYAADGYARMRGGAALLTTFGVGELSAINAVAGSFAEHVPVVHVVGSPSSGAQAAHRMVHHSLGDGVFTHFLAMHADITCATAALTAETAGAEIDRVLSSVRNQRLPGYLLLPADVADAPAVPPSAPLPPAREVTDPDSLAGFVAAARALLEAASDRDDVRVLAGLLVHRFGAEAELAELLSAGPLVHATSLWGKSVVDESDRHFVGIYAGAASAENVRRAVEDAPILITAGVQFTDLNSGFFTQKITRTRTIEIGPDAASVGAALFSPISLAAAVRALTPLIAEIVPGHAAGADPDAPTVAPTVSPGDAALTQRSLWDAVDRSLRPGDIVLADQGCSFYGMATHRLPHDVTFIGQPLWASIGYALPALLGACLAAPGRRGVLLIGDGAAQMTIQELSTVFRSGLAPVVVVLDNDGYTVERAIHGPDEPYNDIARWDWTLAPSLFAPNPSRSPLVARATTVGELQAALDTALAAPDRLSLIQAVVPRMDVPDLLTTLARSASGANARRD